MAHIDTITVSTQQVHRRCDLCNERLQLNETVMRIVVAAYRGESRVYIHTSCLLNRLMTNKKEASNGTAR